jgi:RecB family exonuclease
MDIKTISVSRKSVFDECPAKYKYKYHFKLDSGLPEPFYFVYGKIIHKIAEEYVEKKGENPLNEVAKQVLQGKIPIEENTFAPKLPDDYKKRMPGHLKSIKKLTDRIGTQGITEWRFEHLLDDNRIMNGVIDRLIEKDKKYWIIDYKTTKKGNWRKTPTTITQDLQLKCYARVVQKKLEVPANDIQAALYYLEGGNLIGAKFSDESLVETEKEMLTTFKKIEEMKPEEATGNVGRHCTRCDFRKMCAYYKAPSNTAKYGTNPSMDKLLGN